MKESELDTLKKNIGQTLTQYNNIPLANDCTKVQAAQVLLREVKMVSDEEKRIFDENMQKDRFELEKDHKYFTEDIEKKKFEYEKDSFNKRLEMDENRNKNQYELDKLKLSIEERKLDLETSIYEMNKSNAEKERRFKLISLGATILVPAIVTLAELFVYRKLAYSNLKLIYVDEGRPTVDFKDSVKSVKNLIK